MKVSIYKRYTLVVSLALFTTVLAFMAIVRWTVVGYYEQKVQRSDAQLIQILATHIEQSIRAEDEIVGTLAGYPGLLQLPLDEQQAVLRRAAKSHPHYELLATVDLAGNQIARSWGAKQSGSDRAWYQDFMSTGHGAISDVYQSLSTHNAVVTITKGIKDMSGKPEGILIADVRTTDLRNLIESVNSDPEGEVYLLDNSKHPIAVPDGRDAETIDRVLAGVERGGIFDAGGGRHAMGVSRTIEIPELGVHWQLLLVRDYEAALAPVASILHRTLVLGFAIALLAIGALYAMSRRMTRGFERAGQILRLVGQGDYSQRFEYQGRDELADIAKNLNHMVDLLVTAQEKQQASAEKIRDMAYHDGLTGLPNRRRFMNTARRVLVEAYGKDRLAALFFLDLDKFKEVNDTYGHAAGDELLVEVSRRLTEVAGRAEIVCRLGGDEFLMFLPGANDLEVAQKAQAVIDALERPFLLGGGGIEAHISGSIGVARYPVDARTVDDLVQLADAAMYEAKQAGRGRYVVTHGSGKTEK